MKREHLGIVEVGESGRPISTLWPPMATNSRTAIDDIETDILALIPAANNIFIDWDSVRG